MRITDLGISKLRAPAKGAVVYPDQTLAGFGVRVSQGGTRTFVLTYGKERTRVSIGRYPIISLLQARAEARRILAEETLGKRRPKSVEWNVAVEGYLKEIEETRKPRTHRDYKRLLGRFKFRALVNEVSPQDIDGKLSKLRSFACEHYHAFSVLRSFLHWCFRKHYLDVHPMARMVAPSPGKARKRILSDEELGKVWRSCGEDRFSRLVKFLILYGQRRGESSAITHNMMGPETLSFPPEIVKNNREHTLPLTPLARTIIGDGLSWSGFSKSKVDLDKRSGVTGWTLHDLRRTFRTGLGKLGVRPDIAERLINHSSSRDSIVDVYDIWKYLPEMKAALEKWEAHVLDIAQTRMSGGQLAGANSI